MRPGEYTDYESMLKLMAEEDRYGYCPEKNMWMFYRRLMDDGYEISVEMDDGEVVDARFRMTRWMSNVVNNYHVTLRSDAPEEAVKAAYETPAEDLNKPYKSEFSPASW